ncbi:MAG: hypothetical protein V3S69_07845 [Dehalococcoidales bacterium]
MAKTVNEKSPLYMTLVFKDELQAPLVPTTVEWRLDDMETEPPTEVVAWTVIPSPLSTMKFTIPGSNNVIGTNTKTREEKMFGIRVNDGMASEAHQEFQYHVLNLTGPSGA